MNIYYKLEWHKAVECSLTEWAVWFETADRKVARTEIEGVIVSTVFLWTDYAFWPWPKEIFETMIFWWEHESYIERYSNWDDAVEWHKKAVELITNN